MSSPACPKCRHGRLSLCAYTPKFARHLSFHFACPWGARIAADPYLSIKLIENQKKMQNYRRGNNSKYQRTLPASTTSILVMRHPRHHFFLLPKSTPALLLHRPQPHGHWPAAQDCRTPPHAEMGCLAPFFPDFKVHTCTPAADSLPRGCETTGRGCRSGLGSGGWARQLGSASGSPGLQAIGCVAVADAAAVQALTRAVKRSDGVGDASQEWTWLWLVAFSVTCCCCLVCNSAFFSDSQSSYRQIRIGRNPGASGACKMDGQVPCKFGVQARRESRPWRHLGRAWELILCS
jgi:hypothetical protein